MKVTIKPEAALLYKEEMELEDGDYLRLYVRIGGVGSGGYSIGVGKEKPEADAYVLQEQGIYFFVNPQDQWYLDGMIISYDSKIDLLHFENPNIYDVTNPR
ncbi:HesB/YadR/YfhF family protein [Salibacterium aidingense]|uniref:HesB/YadR/YfhF family protein n=1 Tax=Salibacterium aidingense TaxID=384933 RepID=UPI00042700B0|nr:iron-sulfur cluster biosynthesis family protein [Salibacterium aidingense]